MIGHCRFPLDDRYTTNDSFKDDTAQSGFADAH